MKSIFTALIILSISFQLFGQEFAPIGAKWHVQTLEPFGGMEGTLTNESISETSINGLECKIIYKSQGTIVNPIVGSYTLCQSNDSIFHYIPELDTLNLVMDFGAEIGESWETFDRANEHVSFGWEFNQKYVVDSISYIFSENSDSIKVQHLSSYAKTWDQNDSEYNWNGNLKLIQYIGFEKALLPINDGDGFTDDILEYNVRCYTDPNLGLIKLTDQSSCEPSSIDKIDFTSVNIYPNPSKDQINIEGLDELNITHIKILDNKAQLLKQLNPKHIINVSELENGVYYLQFINSKSTVTKKFLILR